MNNYIILAFVLLSATFGSALADDEKIFITTRFEDGPLPVEILKVHPLLTFVGTINGKSYYYDPLKRTWPSADNFCRNLGMTLAHFDSKAESDFVYSRVPSIELWTDGRIPVYLSNFRWGSGGTVPSHSLTYNANAVPKLTYVAISGDYARFMSQNIDSKPCNPLCVI